MSIFLIFLGHFNQWKAYRSPFIQFIYHKLLYDPQDPPEDYTEGWHSLANWNNLEAPQMGDFFGGLFSLVQICWEFGEKMEIGPEDPLRNAVYD